jgi:predicted nucleic acid-binding protein
LKLFIDTWGWLVLADRKDPLHGSTTECYRERAKFTGQVLTSNFVLDETITLLFLRLPFDEAWRFVTAILHSPYVTIESVTETRFRQAFALRKSLEDKPKISFTDLTSMVIMKEMKITDVLTADQHFVKVGTGFRTLPVPAGNFD